MRSRIVGNTSSTRGEIALSIVTVTFTYDFSKFGFGTSPCSGEITFRITKRVKGIEIFKFFETFLLIYLFELAALDSLEGSWNSKV